jgi:NAD(P)-dependent dehydrogenase (short-subunit alcohol dehydrogenase family)
VLNRLRAAKLSEDVVTQWAADINKEGLDACERLILIERGPFCFGAAPTIADICLVPQLYNARRFKVDVSKAAEVEAMVNFAVEKLGTLNGIFNNAGIGLVKPFLEMDPATYLKVIEVDQHSVYYGMYYAARKMVSLGAKGAFVNTASIYGTTAAVGSFNYNAAKAAVIMMTRSAALELAAHGIRVVAVAPGFINTPILGDDVAMKEALANQHLHRKLIEPAQVASVVAFLFSEGASAINGSTIPVEDGFQIFKNS